METNHMATPWKYRQKAQHFVIEACNPTVAVAEVRFIGRPDGSTSELDAEFIVTACNTHDQMIAALILAGEALKYSAPKMHYAEPVARHDAALKSVRAALIAAGVAVV